MDRNFARQGEIPIVRATVPQPEIWMKQDLVQARQHSIGRMGTEPTDFRKRVLRPDSLRKVKQGETEKNDECIGER